MAGPLIRVFSSGRQELASLMPAVQSVSWILNDVGQAQFFVPYTDKNCTTDILSIGNFVLFEWVYPEHEDLPIFGGVIDIPRSRGIGGVVLTAYTGERILSWFETGAQEEVANLSPGNMFKEFVGATKIKYSAGLVEGDIYDDGSALTKEWTIAQVLDVVRTLAQDSGQDFGFIPSVTGGTLSFEYNWYLSRGRDVSDKVLFAEGVNVGTPILDEQGPIVNQVTVYGAGNVWDGTRLTGKANDDESLSDYGWREASLISQESKNEADVILAARQYLSDHKNPLGSLSLGDVTDKEPGRWADFALGDRVSLDVCARGKGGGWHIQDKGRITGMQWMPNNTMRLNILVE